MYQLLILILGAILFPLLFVGWGWVFTRFLPLSLGHASILSAAAVFLMVLIAAMVTFFSSGLWHRTRSGEFLDYWYREDEEDDGDDVDEAEDVDDKNMQTHRNR